MYNFFFFLDCSFAIAASNEHSTYRLALNIDHPSDTEIITAATFTSLNNMTNAVIIGNQTIASHCQIDSLEVYRGRKQSTRIRHDGFYLNKTGTIKVCNKVV